MAIKYQPKNVLRKMASKKSVKNLVKKDLDVRKAALNAIDETGILSKKELEKVALRVLKDYRKRVERMQEAGYTKAEAIAELASDPKLLIQRVQNATVHKITQELQKKYRGEYYIWLPSTAAVPDPDHMKKYGKRYQIGRGEMPGDRFGCQCGMEILVPEKRLKLD